MSPAIDWRENGDALVRLFLRAREEGPTSEAGRDMTEVVLPELLDGLRRAFPAHVSAEAYGLAWIRMHQPAFTAADSPVAWLRFSVRKDLLAAVTAHREEMASEYMDLCESPSQSIGPAASIFDELEQLLVSGGWPADVAATAIATIESRAELGKFTPGQMLREMTCVPRCLREELLRFVSARDGYLYGRLQGIPRDRLLETAAVCEYLDKLCVIPSYA